MDEPCALIKNNWLQFKIMDCIWVWKTDVRDIHVTQSSPDKRWPLYWSWSLLRVSGGHLACCLSCMTHLLIIFTWIRISLAPSLARIRYTECNVSLALSHRVLASWNAAQCYIEWNQFIEFCAVVKNSCHVGSWNEFD